MKALNLILVLLTLSSCYTPLRNNVAKWSFSACDRKTITDRTCSGAVYVAMIPVQLLALVGDLPFMAFEFFFKVKPFKDPMAFTPEIKEGVFYTFSDQDNSNKWLVKKVSNRLTILKVVNGLVTQRKSLVYDKVEKLVKVIDLKNESEALASHD